MDRLQDCAGCGFDIDYHGFSCSRCAVVFCANCVADDLVWIGASTVAETANGDDDAAEATAPLTTLVPTSEAVTQQDGGYMDQTCRAAPNIECVAENGEHVEMRAYQTTL